VSSELFSLLCTLRGLLNLGKSNSVDSRICICRADEVVNGIEITAQKLRMKQ